MPFGRRNNVLNRLILAAGVAALAISAPAGAKPDGERGGRAAAQQGGGGQQRVQRAERPQRMERQAMPRFERQQQRVERQAMPRFERRQQRAERQSMPRIERQQQRAERTQRFAAFRQERVQNNRQAERRAQRVERIQRVERQEVRNNRLERQQRVAERQQIRNNRIEREQRFANRIDRQQVREQRFANRVDRQQLRNDRLANRFDRSELRNERIDLRNARVPVARLANGGSYAVGYGMGGCPPGLADKGCVPPGQALKADRFIADSNAFRTSRLAALAFAPQARIIDPYQAAGFLGSPLATVANSYPLMALPSSVSYLYPDSDDYYYRYGGGYLYRVERDNDLINWVLPLIAGGFMPGQYLPSSYMNSYVPNYYGFNSFYPSSYGPDYGYDNLCNRYVNGVVYQVDCYSGVVEDVIPLYAGGYGVGQYLPASYGYYNVPYQYRDMYYNTSDYNYWYAPGAIYQVDPSTQLISAVASLLAPGFSIGQQLPAGYGMYNVPLAYRDTYYDTPNAWYRYNNGYIYQVDPTTQLVTAIVASILT